MNGKKITCDEHGRLTSMPVDELSDDELEQISDHEETCEACAEKVGHLENQIWRAISVYGSKRFGLGSSIKPEKEIADNVLTKVRDLRQKRPGPKAGSPAQAIVEGLRNLARRIFSPRLLSLARDATIILLVVFCAFLYSRTDRSAASDDVSRRQIERSDNTDRQVNQIRDLLHERTRVGRETEAKIRSEIHNLDEQIRDLRRAQEELENLLVAKEKDLRLLGREKVTPVPAMGPDRESRVEGQRQSDLLAKVESHVSIAQGEEAGQEEMNSSFAATPMKSTRPSVAVEGPAPVVSGRAVLRYLEEVPGGDGGDTHLINTLLGTDEERIRDGGVSVNIEDVPGVDAYKVVVKGIVTRKIDEVYGVITDYDDYAEIWDRIEAAKVLKRPPEHPVTLWCKMNLPWLVRWITGNVEYTIELRHEVVGDAIVVAWKTPEGHENKGVKVNYGNWTLLPLNGDSTLVIYTLYTKTDFIIEGFVMNLVRKATLPGLIEKLSLVREKSR